MPVAAFLEYICEPLLANLRRIEKRFKYNALAYTLICDPNIAVEEVALI
jgi:hypothetical protein